MLVRKVLTQVGLGSIFSDIVCKHPTIKNQVGEHVFRYIISKLGCVRCFTDSDKQMCGCTECVSLHSLHPLLQAKRRVMHRKFVINSQHRTTKAPAKKMARGWGAVGWHIKPSLAIKEGTCCRSPDFWAWTDHSQISLPHLPTPPKCNPRAILALINNLGIVYHQYCSSSYLDLSISAPIPAQFTAPGNGNQVQT